MAISLPALPYEFDALEPHISARTVEIHYTKHHQGYVNKVNAALEAAGVDSELEEIVLKADGKLFNSAAQVWNHTFYWACLSPDAKHAPEGTLFEAVNEAFGSFDDAKAQFAKAAASEFGSGWAWLVYTPGGLEIISTTDAENPVREGKIPLLTLDVWEHAYYLDWQNKRGDYIAAVMDNLLDWGFAEANFEKALGADAIA